MLNCYLSDLHGNCGSTDVQMSHSQQFNQSTHSVGVNNVFHVPLSKHILTGHHWLTDWAVVLCHTHTHTHTFTHTRLTALCPGLPGWAGTRKVKPTWILLKQRDSEWQWHQLGRMQVCTSLQTDDHASTPLLSFLQAGCSSCRPTNSVKALKAYSTQNRSFQRRFPKPISWLGHQTN